MIDTDTGKILNAPRAYQYMGPVLTEVKDFTQEQKEAYDILGESFVESGFFPDLKSGDVGILRQIASIFPRASYDSYPFPYSRAPKRKFRVSKPLSQQVGNSLSMKLLQKQWDSQCQVTHQRVS